MLFSELNDSKIRSVFKIIDSINVQKLIFSRNGLCDTLVSVNTSFTAEEFGDFVQKVSLLLQLHYQVMIKLRGGDCNERTTKDKDKGVKVV